MKLDGFAIVTGSARGIGEALAYQTAEEGYDTVINYVSDSSAEAAQAVADKIKSEYGVGAIVVQADVSKYEECERLVQAGIDAFGDKIAVLINNAGIDDVRPYFDVPIEDENKMLTTNLNSQYYMCKVVTPYMAKQNYGNIINLSSIAGVQGNIMVGYGTTKAGVIGLTKSLARVLAPNKVIVNAIAPGMFETRLVTDAPPELREMYLQITPLGSIGTMEEMRRLAHYLLNTDFMTGQVLQPNGGLEI